MNQAQHQPVLENNAVNQLSLLAEVFFHRLLNVTDRYGCFDARPGMLRARLFPLKLDDATADSITAWLAECVNAGLIKLYEVNGLPYLQVVGFKRRLGAYKTPYPAPPFEGEEDENSNVEPNTAETKSEPGKEHDYFLSELFKRENEKHLNGLAERIRQPEVKYSWVKAFNRHIADESRRYTVDNDWLNHLKVWLPLNVQQLVKEEQAPRIKQRPRAMVL